MYIVWKPFVVQKIKPDFSTSVRQGVTLVELSVVILIMSILFTMIFSVYFGIARITGNESPISQAKHRSLLALENMRSSINQTYFKKNVKRLVFIGRKIIDGTRRKDRLTFAAVHQGAAAIGVPAVREVSFYIRDHQEDTEIGDLIRREDQMVDKDPGKGGNHYTLLENVISLKFRYSLNGKEWQDDWHHEKLRRIPKLIQIQLKVKIGGRLQVFETLSYTGLYMN